MYYKVSMYIPYMEMILALQMPFGDNLFFRRSVRPTSLYGAYFLAVPYMPNLTCTFPTECHRVKSVQ